MLSSSTLSLFAALLSLAGFLLYRAILPRPIPGIPCDPISVKRILGDVPDAAKYIEENDEFFTFLAQKCQRLGSPVIQVFARPFAKPWVIVSDAREAMDILTRRNKEFDRSDFFGDLLKSTLKGNQVHMKTDSQWKYNRSLVADAMSPQFLSQVAAPQVWSSTLELVDLWRQKARLAQGRPIDVSRDTKYCTIDTIWAATFGEQIGAAASQAKHLDDIERLDLPQDPNAVVEIPETKTPKAFDALLTVAESSELAITNPLGRRAHWFAVNFIPRYARALAMKDQMVRDHIQKAWESFGSSNASESSSKARSAVDLIVEKETRLARKENRPSQHDSIFVHGELGGFLLAGFETTATTLSWGVKYLTHHQDVQAKLRDAIRTAFKDSVDPNGQPSAEAIAKRPPPYLDAFIDEVLRLGGTVSANIRTATVDTEVLGYRIPKGTDVFMMVNGPSMKSSPMPQDESKRSSTSRVAKEEARWHHTDLDKFDPERFLRKDRDGNVQYDGSAAPMQSFGAGVRGCFGRRLAYVEMRVVYTLMLWNFELLSQKTDWRAHDSLSHQPREVVVRLAQVQNVAH